MAIEITNLAGLPRDARAPRRMTTPALAARLEAMLCNRIVQALEHDFGGLLPPDAGDRTEQAVSAFGALYDARPVADNSGGSGFNDSLWIFVLARLLQPGLIVESGVHKGHSTWLFRQACPEAQIHCFDVTLKNRIYIDEKASYFEHDWMESPLELTSADRPALIFFDDHISHAKRLRQAESRGFRLALFDDNFPVYQLYATGGPPVPTLAMIMDDSLQGDCDIEWTRNGKLYSCHYKGDEVASLRSLMARYVVVPELASITRHAPGSGLSFVEIAQDGGR